MPIKRKCPLCGAVVPDGPMGPLCPVCALQGALDLSPKSMRAVSSEQPGDRIGPYTLRKVLGEGGHGTVYLAEQTEPFQRQVALKIIKLGMDTRGFVARFDRERETLALMDHPGIAKVLDAGASEAGRPYLVMELVDGPRITDYCDQQKLSTVARLNLFIQVCRAVQHAHQKGIIHRDIKPSNILVSVHDGVAIPKVIDFGIAKAIEPSLEDQANATAVEQIIGTPAYMSPEQAGGWQAAASSASGPPSARGMTDIDTRSDIYALGVLLYELLTGRTPFEPKELIAAGKEEMRRIIREKTPVKPSTRLGHLTPQDRTEVARYQGTEPPELIRSVQGDLDWIVMKCLEKDRARRYESSSGLARDLEQHLNDEPVTAAAPSWLYLAGKFTRRHRLGLGVAAALLTMLVAGVVVSTWQWRQARTQAKKSGQIAKFLRATLQGVDPAVARGRDNSVLREILDKAAASVGRDLKGEPEVEAELRATLGNVYEAIGDYDKALAMQQEALRLREAVFGKDHALVAESLNDLGVVFLDQGKLTNAVDYFRRTLAMRQKVLTNDAPEIGTSLDNLGVLLKDLGELYEAETMCRAGLALRRRALGATNVEVAVSLHNLGSIQISRSQWGDAEKTYKEVIAMRRKLLGDIHPDLATSIANLGSILSQEGKLEEAVEQLRAALAMQRKLRGPEHKDIAQSLYNLACALQVSGKLAEAERDAVEALAMQRKLLSPNHKDIAATLAGLTAILQVEGKFSEAEMDQREALEIQKKIFPAEHPEIAVSLNNLADVLRVEGKFDAAETTARESLAMMAKVVGKATQYAAYPMETLTVTLRDAGKLTEAEAEARATLELRKKVLPAENQEVAQSRHDLGTILAAARRLDEAETLLDAALKIRRQVIGNDHPDTLDSLNALAAVGQQRGQLNAAESLARECLTGYEKQVPTDWRTFETRALLGGILSSGKKYAEAESFLLAGYAGLKEHFAEIPFANRHRLKDTAVLLAQIYSAMGQPAKAAEWSKTAEAH